MPNLDVIPAATGTIKVPAMKRLLAHLHRFHVPFGVVLLATAIVCAVMVMEVDRLVFEAAVGRPLTRQASTIFAVSLVVALTLGWSTLDLVRRRAETARLRQARRHVLSAIGRGAITMAYQPIVDRAGVLKGFEALMRVRGPDGIGPPAALLADAALAGLDGPLTRAVLARVLADQDATLGQSVPITVNFSVRAVRDIDIDWLITTIAGRGLNIEVTEDAFFDDDPRILERFAMLRGAGARLYLDDFGTGYSSLNHLVAMPIDVLKIDQSFVRQMDRSERHRNLCRAIIDLAATLDLDIVAEGIETQATFDQLVAFGCRGFQGYYIARPMSAAAAMGIIAQSAASAASGGLRTTSRNAESALETKPSVRRTNRVSTNPAPGGMS